MTTVIAAPRIDAPEEPETPRISMMGHNRPPIEEQGVGDFNDAIDKIEGDVRKRLKELVDSASRASADNDNQAGRCATLIKQIDAASKAVEAARVDVKAPYLEAGRKIDAAARTLTADAETAKADVRKKVEAYLRAKAAREEAERRKREQEEAARRAELERAAAEEASLAAAEEREADPAIMEATVLAAARPQEAEPVRVRSDFGQVATARKVKVAVITDWAKAFKAVKSVPAVQDAIQKAVNALVRANQTNIPGVEIKDDIGLSIR